MTKGGLSNERWPRVAMRLPLYSVPLTVLQGVRAGIGGKPFGVVFATGLVILLCWLSRLVSNRVRTAALSQAHERARPYDERLLDKTAPALVRMSLRMDSPVPRSWRPWAEARIEQAYAHQLTSRAGSGYARTPGQRRRASLMAQGINPDNRAAAPLHRAGHPSNWPDKILYWFPLLVIAGSVFIVVATTVITLLFAI